MILSIASPILHTPPLIPRTRPLINLDIPNALSPDNILDLQPSMIIHRPLGDGPPDRIPILHHEVESGSGAVIAGLVRVAPNCVYLSRKLVQDNVTVCNDVRFASIGWDDPVQASVMGGGTRDSCACALVCPFTAAAIAAFGFRAAADVSWVVGAVASGGLAPAGSTIGSGNAHACRTVYCTAVVDGG
ncbi:unnamed protein product [Tuber melanosporum]|uniref:(Perigord truffle) hypothetical protein n=1 Tax=Tuber melanosporum (strain Mel28) TaxID=656061 RepID=D5GEY4_TUBMM|nr:uncharacterized protein GSTUM_00006651001 [Tuber melanosporum]CAZ83077.1 unnamed protein product [Tuber melanosporum]